MLTKEERYQRIDARRKRLKANGCCITCGKKAINANYCVVHREWHLNYQRKYYVLNRTQRQKQQRLSYLKFRSKHPTICQVCNQPIDPQTEPCRKKYHTNCSSLAITVRNLSKPTTSESHRRAVRAYQARHHARGLCICCPLPAIKNSSRCARHRIRTHR